jgi:mycofactocin system glycosyltransferase
VPAPVAAPQTAPLPAGARLALDGSVRRYDGGRVMVGGSPLRLLRLTPDGADRVAGWLDGRPVDDDPRDGRLARRLVDAGLAHPLFDSGPYRAADVTLVVPVKDNAAGLAALLANTAEMADRIVVDDGSATPLPQATLRNPAPRGPAAARNSGWRLAAGELVAFLDSDTVPEPGWLDTVLPLFADPQVAAVAPRVRTGPGSTALGSTALGSTALGRYETDRSSLDMGAEPAAVRPLSRVSYVPTAALVVRRSALAAAGGFDERLRFGEDVDLVWRLVARGQTVRYQPAAVVWHAARPGLRAWLRQRYDYGTSAAPLSARHPDKLCPVRMSRWSAAAWALAAAGHPLAGLAVAAVTAGLLPRKLRGRGLPSAASLGLAARGHLGAGRLLADAVRRTWWPIALLSPFGRRVLLASLLPCLIAAAGRPHDLDRLRWAALRIADDLAYGAGVWAGCLRHRTLRPLRPRFAEWPGRSG